MATPSRYKGIADEVLPLEAAYSERQGDEPTSAPRASATDTSIARAETAQKRALHPSYVEFLKTFDGWDDFSWGLTVFGTKELSDAGRYADACEVFTYGDSPIPDELARGVVIAQDENDATRIILLDTGEVVDWMYEERERHPNLEAFLLTRKRILLRFEAAARKARERIEREWTAEYRSASDEALRIELDNVLARAPRALPETIPRAKSPFPEAVKPEDLVAKEGASIAAEVGLGLVLYLGAAPTKDEVVGTIRAFRKHFPYRGEMQWARASTMAFFPHPADSPDDESFFDAISVDDEGHFGMRVELALGEADARPGSKNKAFLNVRAVPPEGAAGETGEESLRASFVELYLPPYANPDALAAFARNLVDLLPVRSGHAGFFAHVWDADSDPDPNRAVFEWCRRFWGIDVVGIDGWLGAALRRLRGPSWLTIVGNPFVSALDKAKALEGLEEDVHRHDGRCGVILQAGSAPSLCDVARGQDCDAIASVARAVDPLVVQTYAKSGFFSVGGIYFDTFQEELAPFVHHHATTLHLHRFAQPAAFAGPTPREEAETIMAALCKEHQTPYYKEWLAAKKKGTGDGFRDALRGLYGASCGDAVRTDLGLSALRFLVRFPEWAPPQAFSNLLFVLLQRKAWDEAVAFMPAALRVAEKSDPTGFHNAACIFANVGDVDRALECIGLAKKHGYANFAKMKDDEDFEAIAHRPEFRRLFE